jgi:porphobilinogen synthase
MGELRAVVFDFDGLIIDSEMPIFEMSRAALAELGHTITVEAWSSVVGLGDADSHAALCAAVGADVDPETFDAAYQRQDRSWRETIGPLPGVVDLLLALRDADVACGVASSSSAGWCPAPSPSTPTSPPCSPSAAELRRLRRTPALRRLVAETETSHPDDLIAPLFVREGITSPSPSSRCPASCSTRSGRCVAEVGASWSGLGVPAVILFGVPEHKDAEGTGASGPRRHRAARHRELRDAFGDDVVLMADLCLDEYTDHGHCGLLTPRRARSTTTPRSTATPRSAVAQAEAGVDIVAPSGMMDGQVPPSATRSTRTGSSEVAILAYAAKYASALYGPFREAVDVEIAGGGDRKAYQQDWHNVRESLEEIRADIAEGADMVMVKPALTYLDVIARARAEVDVPLAAYHVSGEYAMVQGGGRQRLDRRRPRGARADHGHQARRRRPDPHLLRPGGAEGARSDRPHETPHATDGPATGRSGPADDQRALYERACGDPRRGELAGARLPVRGRHAVLRGPGRGPRVGRRGHRFTDYVQSYGASILGHAHPVGDRPPSATRRCAGTFGAPTEGEVRLAEEPARRVPSAWSRCAWCRPAPRRRCPRSAWPAAPPAGQGREVRGQLPRAPTRCWRPAAGPPRRQQGLSGSAGVTAGAVADTDRRCRTTWCPSSTTRRLVCVEPVAANMGLVPAPRVPRRACAPSATGWARCLMFDEVITGFRLDHRRRPAAVRRQPDVWCFGKVIGGGLPVGAFGASAEIMSTSRRSAPCTRPAPCRGTRSRPRRLASLCLGELTPAAYEQLIGTATTLADGLAAAFADAGVAAQVPRVGPLIGLFFGPHQPTDYDEAKDSVDLGHYPRWFHGMLDRGIALAPGPYEVLFPSLAHSESETWW